MQHTQRAFSRMKALFAAYGALSAGVLLLVAVRAASGLSSSSFMWTRSSLILASAAALLWLTVRSEHGSQPAYERLRKTTVVLPIAIVGVDLIPGLCPAWFAIVQAAGALPLVAAAFVGNGARLRASFAEQSAIGR
ncbi:hypothetical protein [Kitasatospora viridis]|uniref:Uncharacterized protein n=1 Tax=Kitasatospora viridis TaxID=281105 RepID=A0A561UM97_9ACTN|nr:hypothetical protein [Kitasatospora viridis]TWG00498.1 hypothetical protein FHX73_114377 [Kitasatospora viridis]